MERYEEISSNHLEISKEGRKIFGTKHSLERYIDRYINKISEEKVMWVIKNGIEDILNKYNDIPSNYVIHSKSTGIGVVIDWRLDTMNRGDERNHAFIMTLLPLKKSHTHKPSDIYLIVEQQLLQWADVKYVEKYKEKRKFEEGMCTLVREQDFVVVFYEGEYYDDNIHQVIIVD